MSLHQAAIDGPTVAPKIFTWRRTRSRRDSSATTAPPMTAARHLQHHAGAHRTADHVDVVETLFGDELLDGVGQSGDGDLTRQRWALAEAGQVDGDHRALAGQRGDDEVPVVQVGDAVHEQQWPAGSGLDGMHAGGLPTRRRGVRPCACRGARRAAPPCGARIASTSTADLGPAQRLGAGHQPVGQPEADASGSTPHQIVVPVGHEARQQADARRGPGRLHVDEDVGGGHGFAHGRERSRAGQVQVVHLQHGVDEVHQRVIGQFLDAARASVLGQVVARARTARAGSRRAGSPRPGAPAARRPPLRCPAPSAAATPAGWPRRSPRSARDARAARGPRRVRRYRR